jgi:hypothetical protein
LSAVAHFAAAVTEAWRKMHVAAYGGTPRKNEYAKFSNCSVW